MYLKQDIPPEQGILEQYMTNHIDKQRNRTLRSCMKTLQLFGHKAKLLSTDVKQLSLIVDDSLIYRYQPDGRLVKIENTESEADGVE